MNTITRPKLTFTLQPKDEYPASDGMPMAETEVHIMATVHLLSALRTYFRKRDDVYVIGDMFLYYRQGDPKARKAPDVMVAKGVDATIKRRTYKLWEEKVPPCFAVEITSGGTKLEDIVTKPALYAKLGISEYFLFDPLHEYLDEQFIGYRLVDGEYTLLEPDSEGNLYSEELDILLGVDDTLLRIVMPDGEFLPDLEEAVDFLDEAQQRMEQADQRAEQEAQRAEQADQRAEQEAQRAEQEASRRVAAEAEARRLQKRLDELEANSSV